MAMQETHVFEADNLFASNVFPVVADKITIASGQGALKRGALVTAAGALVTAAADVFGVLAEDVDATSAAVDAAVYLTGEFNEGALIVGTPSSGTLSVADCKVTARKIGIFIKPSI